MAQRTIPGEESTRDIAKAVKDFYKVGNYNDLLLEALAQYDPTETMFPEDATQSEKVVYLQRELAIPRQMLEGVDVDLDADFDWETDVDTTTDSEAASP